MGDDRAVGVLVVDDQRPFRSAAIDVVAHTVGFVLAGEARTGEDAVRSAILLRPGLVLMDVRLPDISGVEAAHRILARCPGTLILLCSTYHRDDLPAEVAAAHVAGYVTKADLRPAVLRNLWVQAAAGRP